MIIDVAVRTVFIVTLVSSPNKLRYGFWSEGEKVRLYDIMILSISREGTYTHIICRFGNSAGHHIHALESNVHEKMNS